MQADLERRYVAALEARDTPLADQLAAALDQAGRADTTRLTAPGALANAAAWYARNNIAVFPCEPRGKRPLTRHGLHDASTDVTVIAGWWERWPDANIGAPTGLTFDVIDIDGPDGVAATYGDPSIVFPPAREIGHTLTSRQAGHHVFIEPTGRGNGANIRPHVDYRGAGGYVILPPSVGVNGQRYVWTRPLEVAA